MPNTVLSCFTGVGGLDLGLEAAGFETVGCLETDSHARDAIMANRDWRLLEPHDVVTASHSLKPKDVGLEVGDLTLIAGGPPCQPFSKAAQWVAPKAGVTDDRGRAVEGMLGLVESFLPRAVLMENVAGFTSGANNALPIIERSLAQLNRVHGTHYKIQQWVVDAADYGVPQHRRRAIVVAFRDELQMSHELPTTHDGDHRTAWDALGRSVPKDAPSATGKYADLLPSIPEGSNYQHLTVRGAGPDWELFGYRTRFWSFLLKLAKDSPAWTLPASPGPSTGPFHWDNRPLTARERMLLQGFPADWNLAGQSRDQVRLAGNATPPPLAEAVGRYVLHVLEHPARPVRPEGIRPTLATSKRLERAPKAKAPAPLPDNWRAQVRQRLPHPGPGEGPGKHALEPPAA